MITCLHDWHRNYRTGHTYMGRALWRYYDRSPHAARNRRR